MNEDMLFRLSADLAKLPGFAPVTEEEIAAYVAGQLSDAEAGDVAERLAEDPILAARVRMQRVERERTALLVWAENRWRKTFVYPGPGGVPAFREPGEVWSSTA